VVLAMAMHTEMWEHPAVARNMAVLAGDGHVVIPPESGRLAGGDVGVGRLAEPGAIVAACEQALAPGDLSGINVLITAGGTREPIDPVRYIGNRSSGKMGHALAAVAARRGAKVVLVTTADLPGPASGETVRVETAAEMAQAVSSRFDAADAVVMAAAVADFRPAHPARVKLKKADGIPEIRLVANEDILAGLGRSKAGQFVVGFAAETSDVAEAGVEKAAGKGTDLVVANLVGADDTGFGTDTNRAYLCRPDGTVEDLGLLDKRALAERICDEIVAARAARSE
jgi:phosphopantothenoylcysteine decarboxylase/phosphopantothenate--cysteine ligase